MKKLISMVGLAAALALGGTAMLAAPAAFAQDKAGEMKRRRQARRCAQGR